MCQCFETVWSQSEEKGYSETEKVKTSTFVSSHQTKTTSASNNQCPLKDGDHKLWMCTKFKNKVETEDRNFEEIEVLLLLFNFEFE